MAKRYYTYLNQGEVPARTLLNASAGLRAGSVAMLRDVTVQLSVANLSDRHYVSTVGSNGFVNSDPGGNEQTLLAGAPRTVFLSVSAKL
jgi:iron complex outermembrane receptor protein